MTGPVVKTEGFTHMYVYITYNNCTEIGAENMWELRKDGRRSFQEKKKKKKHNSGREFGGSEFAFGWRIMMPGVNEKNCMDNYNQHQLKVSQLATEKPRP